MNPDAGVAVVEDASGPREDGACVQDEASVALATRAAAAMNRGKYTLVIASSSKVPTGTNGPYARD